ncbi:MAG: hypothetical protein DMG63_03835 [Acidobacteria bacterium]|nr:MAG: hypothetical protein DMG63_03835 [Acidobacteriota bacterium]
MAAAPAQADWQRLAAVIDHTLLKPESPNIKVQQLCREALEYGFACVMLNPTNVALACSLLAGTGVEVGFETALLSLEEKILACQLAVAAGADLVKSSTGFFHAGAVPADISLMRGVVGDKLGVKASGGIRTFEDAQAMIEAGANRIGTSSGVAIVESARAKS